MVILIKGKSNIKNKRFGLRFSFSFQQKQGESYKQEILRILLKSILCTYRGGKITFLFSRIDNF